VLGSLTLTSCGVFIGQLRLSAQLPDLNGLVPSANLVEG
jgi:hypothetical protein